MKTTPSAKPDFLKVLGDLDGHMKSLDKIAALIEQEAITEGMEQEFRLLNDVWVKSNGIAWDHFCRRVCRNHALMELNQLEPLTSRAYMKPRGYPGDAVMMDQIYYWEKFQDGLSDTARAMQRWMAESPAVRAVRERRKICARVIDEIAASVRRPKICSLACGHLREVELSEAFRTGNIQRFTALDHDSESLKEVRLAHHSNSFLHIEKISARDITSGEYSLNDYDLVYALGLFDYLPQSSAQKLVRALFSGLRPGGTLLLPNFKPGIKNVGHMEAFMDWKLVYRDEGDLNDLLRLIPKNQMAGVELFEEENQNILFLKIVKA